MTADLLAGMRDPVKWMYAYADLEHEYHEYRRQVEAGLVRPPEPPRIFYRDLDGEEHLVHRVVKVAVDRCWDRDIINIYVTRYDWIGGEVTMYGWRGPDRLDGWNGGWVKVTEGGVLPVALSVDGVAMHGRTAGDDLDQILELIKGYQGPSEPSVIVGTTDEIGVGL